MAMGYTNTMITVIAIPWLLISLAEGGDKAPAVIENVEDFDLQEQVLNQTHVLAGNEIMMQFLDSSRTKLSSDLFNLDSYVQAYKMSQRYQRNEEDTSDAVARENHADNSRRRLKRSVPLNVTRDVVKFEIEDAKVPDMVMSASQRTKKEVRSLRSPYEVMENGQQSRMGQAIFPKADDMRSIKVTHPVGIPIQRKGRVYSPENFPIPVQNAINKVLQESSHKQQQQHQHQHHGGPKGYENQRYGTVPGSDHNQIYYGDKIKQPTLISQSEGYKNWWMATELNRMKRLQQNRMVPMQPSQPEPVEQYPTHASLYQPQNVQYHHPSQIQTHYNPTYINAPASNIHTVPGPTLATPNFQNQEPKINYYIKTVPYTVVNNEYQTVANVYAQKAEKTQNQPNPFGPMETPQKSHFYVATEKPEPQYETHYITVTEKAQQAHSIGQQQQYDQAQYEYHTLPQNTLSNEYEDPASIAALQALIGQNPNEQLQGLKALLTQEVEQRPQDSTSPIDFGPDVPKAGPTKPPQYQYTVAGAIKQIIPVEPSTPIVETSTPAPTAAPQYYVQKAQPVVITPQKLVKIETSPAPHHPVVHHTKFTNVQYQTSVNPKPLLHHVPSHPTAATLHPVKLHKAQPNPEPYESGENVDEKDLQYASGYAFGYRVRDHHTGNDFGHIQNRDHDGITTGSYHILLPDGRVQNVKYRADEEGFHADVSYESITNH